MLTGWSTWRKQVWWAGWIAPGGKTRGKTQDAKSNRILHVGRETFLSPEELESNCWRHHCLSIYHVVSQLADPVQVCDLQRRSAFQVLMENQSDLLFFPPSLCLFRRLSFSKSVRPQSIRHHFKRWTQLHKIAMWRTVKGTWRPFWVSNRRSEDDEDTWRSPGRVHQSFVLQFKD